MSRLAYAAGSPLILTVTGNTLLAWDATTLAQRWALPFDGPLSVAFAPPAAVPVSSGNPWRTAPLGEACAVVTDQDSQVFVVDLDRQRVATTTRLAARPMATSACSNRALVTLAPAEATHVWLAGSAIVLGPATAVGRRSDAVAIAYDGVVTVYELPAKQVRATWRVGGEIAALAQRPNGVWYAGNERGLFALRDAGPDLIHEGDVRRIVVSLGGTRYALQRTESHVAVYAWDSFQPELRLTGPLDGLAFGRGRLVALSVSGTLSEVDLRTGANRTAR